MVSVPKELRDGPWKDEYGSIPFEDICEDCYNAFW